jgi:Tol biopolymer transport system component
MVRWDGSRQGCLTSTPDSSEKQPRWSPDGRHLALLATRGDEEDEKRGAGAWYDRHLKAR